MSKRAETALLFVLFAHERPANAEDDGRVCFSTHRLNCDSANKDDIRLGPLLHGIFGALTGQVRGRGMYSGNRTGLVRDETTFDRFVAKLASEAQGTSITYPPAGDAEMRRKIIVCLRSIVDS